MNGACELCGRELFMSVDGRDCRPCGVRHWVCTPCVRRLKMGPDYPRHTEPLTVCPDGILVARAVMGGE